LKLLEGKRKKKKPWSTTKSKDKVGEIFVAQKSDKGLFFLMIRVAVSNQDKRAQEIKRQFTNK
jgi:hypothetical protein